MTSAFAFPAVYFRVAQPLGAVVSRYVVPVGFALAMVWVAVVFYLAGTTTQ
jgi:hypothetical protein